MAFNPLQQKMHEQHETPAARGITAAQAQEDIARLLDDDGQSPGHSTVGDENEHVRGSDENLDERPGGGDTGQVDDQDSDDQDQDDDAGDTADAEGSDDDDAAKTGDDDSADTDDLEGEAITTLQGLAEASEMELDEFLSALSHTFPAAGGEVTATLAELVTGHKLKVDYDRDKTAMATERRTFEAEQQARLETYEMNAHVLANQFNLVENALTARLQDPQLIALRDTDQARYLLTLREVETQVNNLQAARQQAAQHYTQTMEGNRQEFMRAEGQKLRDDVDGWNDDMLRTSVDAIKTLGYSDDEVVTVVDSRLIKGALELANLRTEVATLRAQIEEGKKAVKKVKRTVPKGIKAGKQTKRTRGPDKQRVSTLRRRLSQTHDVKDAAKVIESMMT